MKFATLVGRGVKGSFPSISSDSISDLLEQAQKARKSGMLDGVPINAGMVFCSWRSPVMRFHCEPKAAKQAKAEVS